MIWNRFIEVYQILNYVEYLTDLLIPAEFGTTNEIIEMLNKGEIATETTYG